MWGRIHLLTAVLLGTLACRDPLVWVPVLLTPPPPWVVEAQAEVHRTRNALFDRASELVAGVDDGVLDAPTLALALTKACAPEYDAYAQARAVLAGPTDRQRANKLQALESPKEKIRATLPIVQAYRAGQPLKRKDYPG